MSLNKPKYTLIKNTSYALRGLREIIKHENSFKLQILFFIVMGAIAWMLPVSPSASAIMFTILFVPMMAEVINSAVERNVDLVTKQYHELAKRAKDAGAALVFVSFAMVATVWGLVLLIEFDII